MHVVPVSGPINLSSKVALVTGAARGIGRAVSLALAREGALVAVCDIISCQETIDHLQKKGGLAHMVHCDVQRKDSIAGTVKKVIEKWGKIDILISNAGILGDSAKPFTAYTEEEIDTVLAVNLRGTILMCQAVWPWMEKQGGGKIVCLGSIAGRIGGVLAGPHYCASKGGIHSFVKWAAKFGAKSGILVNGIAPGPIVTPMTDKEPYRDDMVPLGRLGQPEDIAEATLFLASQASNFITGKILDVNGGMLMI